MTDAWCHDGIEVSRLIFDQRHCIGTDAWGRKREQPVLTTVRLAFRKSFDSAASTDSLDESTINYGLVSKKIKAIRPAGQWEPCDGLCERLHQSILETLVSRDSLETSEVRLHLPKASPAGSEVIVSSKKDHGLNHAQPEICRSIHLSNLRFRVLVGINAVEREAKQPLQLHLWLSGLPSAALDAYTTIEQRVLQTLEESCFETLEALAIDIAAQLWLNVLNISAPEAWLRLRIEKPLAVPSAEAPCIEVARSPAQLARMSAVKTKANDHSLRQLIVRRPYVA